MLALNFVQSAKPEGIVAAEILLREERKPGEIFQRFQVRGMHARGFERAAVVRNVLVGVKKGLLEPLELQGSQLIEPLKDKGVVPKLYSFF